MEEYVQDQETVIQQLRLLLAAKEEELGKLRTRRGADDGHPGETVADHLIKELEEKKEEAAQLQSRLKEVESKAREKLAAMAEALDEKEKIIATIRAGQQTPAGDVHTDETVAGPEAALAVERDAAARRCAELEERLREAEALLARRDEAKECAAPEGSEVGRLLREIEAIQKEEAQLKADYEARLMSLQAQLDSRMEEERAGAPPKSAPQRGMLDLQAELEQEQMSARTLQVQLRGLRRTQQVLQGLCAGLGVTLMFTLAMKVKQYQPAPAEAALLAKPVTHAGAPRGEKVVDEDMLPPPEISSFPRKMKQPETAKPTTPLAAPSLQASAAPSRKAGSASAYTVKKGVNRWLICRRELGDPGAVAMVLRDNRIADPGALRAGDIIYLPRK